MHMMRIKHANTGEEKELHWGNKCLVGRTPLGKARLCWQDETLVGKETSLGKTFHTREVKASPFAGDEKGASSFTGDEKISILNQNANLPFNRKHHRSTDDMNTNASTYH